MANVLTDEQLAAFRRDGVVHVPAVIDADTVERMRGAVRRLVAAPSRHGANITPKGEPGMFFQDRHLFPHDREFEGFLFETPFAQMAAEATGSATVRGFYEQVFVKEPGTRESFAWHQDRPYWNVDGMQICSTWLALSSADVVSSSLEFVRGSHRWGKTFRPEYPGLEGRDPKEVEALLWRGLADYIESFEDVCPEFEAYPERYDVTGFAVEPGDVLLFDYRVVHRSGPNAGNARREAISWRWLGDDAVWAPKSGGDPIVLPKHTFLAPGERITDDAVFPIVYPSPTRRAAPAP